MPAVLRAQMGEPHRVREKGSGDDEIALDHARAFQSANLMFDRDRASIPRRESAA